MATTFMSADRDEYRMDPGNPFLTIEPIEMEVRVVGDALAALVEAGILPHGNYDIAKMLALREAVKELFEIPWTAITPRMQRLIYAINAITQPQNMLAAGIFCGNTFISNAGAAVGPGACYQANDLVGIEIKPEEAERAERNVRKIDPTCVANIVAADAVDYAAEYPEQINLLYLDADGDARRGKGIYLDILEASLDKMPKGSIVLAHNSHNAAERLAGYLKFVRDPALFISMNVIFDGEGLEVSAKR